MMEHTNYVALFSFKNNIRESGRTIAQLNEAEINQLISFAEASQGLSSAMAKGILCFFYDICWDAEGAKARKHESAKAEISVENKTSVAEGAKARMEESKLDNITLIPNPTTGELRMENGELKIENVEVFDIYGRKVHSSTRPLLPSSTRPLVHPSTTLNISHLPTGLYFVKITTEHGHLMKKIVKQ